MLQKIRKNPFISKTFYSVYHFANSIYLRFGRHFLKRFRLERNLAKTSEVLRKHNIKDLHFKDSHPYIESDGRKFYYMPESRGGCVHVLNDAYEKRISEIIGKYIKDDSIIFDVGSNFGFFTMQASKKATKGKIYAFEPVPESFGYLERNIKINNLENHVTGIWAAVSDKQGTIRITTNKFGGNHILNRIRSGSAKNTAIVKSMTIDSFCAKNKINRLDLLKCDVEGAELMVLRGAKSMIKRCMPIIILEIQENWAMRFGYAPSEIFDLLKDLGYNYSLITNKGIIRPTTIGKDLEKTNNFLFVSKS